MVMKTPMIKKSLKNTLVSSKIQKMYLLTIMQKMGGKSKNKKSNFGFEPAIVGW